MLQRDLRAMGQALSTGRSSPAEVEKALHVLAATLLVKHAPELPPGEEEVFEVVTSGLTPEEKLVALQGRFKKLEDFSDEQKGEVESLREECDEANKAVGILTRSNDELKRIDKLRHENAEKVTAKLREMQAAVGGKR